MHVFTDSKVALRDAIARSSKRLSPNTGDASIYYFKSAEGFDHGVVVEGGVEAWIAAGLPVKRGEVKIISLERQVRIVAGALLLSGVLLALLAQ